MTTFAAANMRNAEAKSPRDTTGGIGLAAAPTFALMAWIAAVDSPRFAIRASASAMPPIDGMAWMYLPMSFFHVRPWLKFAFRPSHLAKPKETDHGTSNSSV